MTGWAAQMHGILWHHMQMPLPAVRLFATSGCCWHNTAASFPNNVSVMLANRAVAVTAATPPSNKYTTSTAGSAAAADANLPAQHPLTTKHSPDDTTSLQAHLQHTTSTVSAPPATPTVTLPNPTSYTVKACPTCNPTPPQPSNPTPLTQAPPATPPSLPYATPPRLTPYAASGWHCPAP
jgi:hypothetical protein